MICKNIADGGTKKQTPIRLLRRSSLNWRVFFFLTQLSQCLIEFKLFCVFQDGRDNFKIFSLYLHMVVIVGLSIAACVIIGIASHEGHDDHDD